MLAVAAPALACLVVTPGLAGHAGAQDSALLIPMDTLHVLAMSAWVGGVALLLAARAGRATRSWRRPGAPRLLSAVLDRFSLVALAAVAVLVATGVLQSVVQLDSFARPHRHGVRPGGGDQVGAAARARRHRRLQPPPGAAGAAGRGRARARRPGRPGVSIRRALRAELALMAAVLAVAAALVSYPPGAGAAGGPFAADRELGPARLELTVDPARVGRNEIHLYLFDRRTGAQYERFDELTVTQAAAQRRAAEISARSDLLRAREHRPGPPTTGAATGATSCPGWRAGSSTGVPCAEGEFDLYETLEIEVPVK